MAEEGVGGEKTYKDWLTEALARDQETWDALDRKLARIKAAAAAPRPPARPPKPLDW